MFMNAGFLNNSKLPFKDKSKPLIVGSCGTYRLIARPKLPTWRPHGRLDYQIVYVASGKAHFYFHGEEQVIPAGHMVLFLPRQEQRYDYYAKDKPEVYWVHFTGSNVKNILRSYGIPLDEPVINTGVASAYQHLFSEMIHELQTCRTGYQEMLEMYLRQLLLTIQRYREESTPSISIYLQESIDAARRYFNEHYNEEINIEQYAESIHMSTCWFARNFKKVAGCAPLQYITNVRIRNASTMLESSNYTIEEIAGYVGYENPFYFSRVFKKIVGLSPLAYRKSKHSSVASE